MAFLVALIVFACLLVWNTEAFVRKHSRMPKVVELLSFHTDNERRAFNFIFLIFLVSLTLFLFGIYRVGVVDYMHKISARDACLVLLFLALSMSYFVRLSIYLKEHGALINKGNPYLWNLWKIKAKNAPIKIRILLWIANILIIFFVFCVTLKSLSQS